MVISNQSMKKYSAKKGQMKIMQMMFMIIGVFLFFVLVGLFFLRVTFGDIHSTASELAKEQAISSIKTISAMPELDYDSRKAMALDEDKLMVMASGLGNDYENFLPVASIEVYKIYPIFDKVISCPAPNCNYYEIYNSGQKDITKVSSYVSICKKLKEFGTIYTKCEVGKIVIGVKKNE